MNSCSKNRKRIAWLALGVSDARQASALRDHLVHCEPCRRYQEEISHVTERLSAAQPETAIQASESFHQRLAGKLRAAESSSGWESLTAVIRATLLDWRKALPVSAALILAVCALVAVLRQQPASVPPVPPTAQAVSAVAAESDLPPTLANYQMLACQSLKKLDAVLTAQGNKSLPPAPVYTAATFRLANTTF